MAAPYQPHRRRQQQQPGLDFHRHHQWPLDEKPACTEDDEMVPLEEKILDRPPPTEVSADHDSRHPCSVQSRQTSFSLRSNMWHEPSHQIGYHHPPQQVPASVPLIDTSCSQYQRIDAAHDGAYNYQPSWPTSAISTTSTPTPMFDHTGQEMSPMAYHGEQINFNQAAYPIDPFSATPMSPQSSQGGWMSATSSDGTESRSRPMLSPDCRAASPTDNMRPDAMRKKNARFEIPPERNLANIDSLILQTANEQEKKELKQQKRLLRNRQAALDSRQRKKLHTEKLELEKKESNQHLSDLQEENRQLQQALQRETAMWRHQQQKYEHFIHNISFERDEAIRTKTLETAELRKMNRILKDHLRDYDRREYARQCAAQSHHHAGSSNQVPSFDEVEMEDGAWEDDILGVDPEFSDRTHDVTPTPPQEQTANDAAADSKSEAPFSLNAFYMCLLFGAFIASNSGSKSRPAVPALSEEYRTESANVLKAILPTSSRGPPVLPSSLPTPQAHGLPPQTHTTMPATISASEMAMMTEGLSDNLGALHHSLTTPSRRQRETAAFSLSAASYQHLTDPDPLLSATEAPPDGNLEVKPSRLETAFNAMQESNHEIDKIMNRGLNERSHMWERVPDKVLRDFRRMVQDADLNP